MSAATDLGNANSGYAGTSAPRATARLQLHPGFTLADAAERVDYYAALGVSHLYLSPVCCARPGSTHGYDVTDFAHVRAELGGEAALLALSQRARAACLGLILDIVPNHMAADATHNAWWRDVLAHGRHSEFAAYFDIDWQPREPALRDKVLVPILGNAYWDVLSRGELRVTPGTNGKPPSLRYFDHELPLAPGSLGASVRPDEFAPGRAGGRDRLHALLERQHYRLAWWRTAAAMLNWRRFFEVSDLVGLRQEHPPVFDAVHALPLRLLREGHIDGVRVDHVDGLADPAAYCRHLRTQLAAHAAQRPAAQPLAQPWLVVEKILAAGEALPASWQVDGTTGYDFMEDVCAVLHDPAGKAPLTALWERISGDPRSYPEIVTAVRRYVLQRHLTTEYESLGARLHARACVDPATRDLTLAALRQALSALLSAVPVYRSYLDGHHAAPADDAMLDEAAQAARVALAPDEDAALDFILGCLRTQLPPQSADGAIRQRLQQLMPALAAKAGEDTAFYRYGRLLSRNEVGSEPATLAIAPASFHARMHARQLAFPHGMLATATHDHKRGEDARMRLAVLSEVADDWTDAVAGWERDGAAMLAALPLAPDPADRLMLYQTLTGAWPMAPDALAGNAARDDFLARIGAWQRKAIREAKRHGSWTRPDLAYEQACESFLQGLARGWPEGLLARIGHFAQRIAPAGALNSLAQVMVQLTVPGVPDRYQGCEGWDFSLVDPDNRRPPDFARLQAQLGCTAGWAHWLAHWRDGRIKQQLIRRVLAVRGETGELLSEGQYSEVPAHGTLAPQVLAFARTTQGQQAITVVSRLAARHVDPALPRIPPACWSDTTLDVSAPHPSRWTDALTARPLSAPSGHLHLRDVLAALPVALLLRDSP